MIHIDHVLYSSPLTVFVFFRQSAYRVSLLSILETLCFLSEEKGLMVMQAIFEFLREQTIIILIVAASISTFIEMLIAVYVPFLFVQ